MDIKERFWSKTRVNKEHEWGGSNCIDWTAYRNPDGYGQFSIKRKPIGAHRVAFELTNGEIRGLVSVTVRPTECESRSLFLGTIKRTSKTEKERKTARRD